MDERICSSMACSFFSPNFKARDGIPVNLADREKPRPNRWARSKAATRADFHELEIKLLHLLDHSDALKVLVAVNAISRRRPAGGTHEASPFVEANSLHAHTGTLCNFADSHT